MTILLPAELVDLGVVTRHASQIVCLQMRSFCSGIHALKCLYLLLPSRLLLKPYKVFVLNSTSLSRVLMYGKLKVQCTAEIFCLDNLFVSKCESEKVVEDVKLQSSFSCEIFSCQFVKSNFSNLKQHIVEFLDDNENNNKVLSFLQAAFALSQKCIV